MAERPVFRRSWRCLSLLTLSLLYLINASHKLEYNVLGFQVGWFNHLNKVILRPQRSKRFYNSRSAYYANSDASFQLERIKLSGDVNPNPGPDSTHNHQQKEDDIGMIPGNGLKIGQWNVNNLTDAKFEQIKLLLSSKAEIDVLFLIETFLKSTKPDSVLKIHGYTLIRKDRAGQKKGGGILAYIADNLKADRITSLEDNTLETLWLQINPYKSKRPILVGAIYRPPSTTADTDTKLELNIEAAYLRNQEMYILGDFNINYLDTATYKKHRLVKALKSLSLSQAVETVTRPKSSSCLDHVYTTHPTFIANISVPNIGLADHLPVFIRRKYCRKKNVSKHNTIEFRDFQNLNKESLLHDLENVSWDTTFESKDVDEVLCSLEKTLNEILNRHIPLKTKRVKRPNQPAWMTKEILDLLKTRDKLLKKARNTNEIEDWNLYTHSKCKIVKLIKKTKRNFFREKIDQNKGNPKGIWNALKNLSGTSKTRTQIKELETGNGTVCDEKSIANELNSYFTNILEQLGNDQLSDDTAFDDSKLREFISSRLNTDRTFVIPEITPQQVTDIIGKISVNKATGHDGISAKVLKHIIPAFINPLCRLLNLSITTNTFPDQWKVGQVTPLHKGGKQSERNNYRPISVLPILSKILEKHVASSFFKYLRDNNLLYALQSAFRTGHSTETALIRITDEILFNMDKDEITGLVFIDFRKAFDVIDHRLLLKKLSAYGASQKSVAWFQSYLEGRRQFVKLGQITSEQQSVKQGVPQGSILGPVLFLLFVNDMPLYLKNTTIDIYADDTTLSLSTNWNDISSLTDLLSKDLEDTEKWSRQNKMFINIEKTKSMLITGKRLRHKLPPDSTDLQIQLHNTDIEQVTNHKLLGVYIDQDLTYEIHIDELCKKLSKRLGLLRHISPYLKQSQRMVFYLAVIKPLLMYLSSIWSSCTKDILERALRMQKRAARIILDAERTTRTITLFNALNWVPFYTDSYINRCSMAHKRLGGLTPDYINNILKTNSDIHTRSTRFSKLNFHCPLYKKSTEGGRTFSVRTIKEWNQLPIDIKKTTNIKNFKRICDALVPPVIYKGRVQRKRFNS